MVKIGVGKVEGIINIGTPAVVTLKGGKVVDVHPLNEEEPFTIWIGGVASIGEQLFLDGRPVDEDFINSGVF